MRVELKGEMRAESARGSSLLFKTVGLAANPVDSETVVSEDDTPWPEITFAVTFAFAVGAVIAIDALRNSDSLQFHLPLALAVLLVAEGILLGSVLRHYRQRGAMLKLLKENEERTSIAAASAGLGVWRWDSTSDQFWANRTCQEALGLEIGPRYSADTVMAHVHPDDRSTVENAAMNALHSSSTTELEFRAGSGQGEPRWLLARAIPLPAGESVQVSGTILDITERKNMELEVEQQKQSLAHLTRVGMVGELSSALVHELNQPLSAILSNAQAAQRMLKNGTASTQALGEAISDIIDDDTRASDVIKHLRDFLKDGASSFVQIDLNEVISDTLELVKNDLINRHITVLRHLQEERMTVSGDPVQLQQVILNIIMNAVQAMGEKWAETAYCSFRRTPFPAAPPISRYRTMVPEYPAKSGRSCSSRSTPPRSREWGLGYPSVDPLLHVTAAGYGPSVIWTKGRHSTSTSHYRSCREYSYCSRLLRLHRGRR